MPRFRALQDNELPSGVHGPAKVLAGDYITVSGDEAALLLAQAGLWLPADTLEAEEAAKTVRPQRNRMVTGADNVKGGDPDEGLGSDES